MTQIRTRLAAVTMVAAAVAAGTAGAAQATSLDDGGGKESHIVGGTVSTTAKHPWAIQLSYAGSPSPTKEWCGGTLVAANKVVTAAHCVKGRKVADFTAIQGRDKLADKTKGKQSKLAKVWFDPKYGKTPGHDVAVVTLKSPFKGVSVMKLNKDKALGEAKISATVYGWGATEGTLPDDTFAQVTVRVLGDAVCKKAEGNQYTPGAEVCAGLPKGGKDSCQGDSGGPLIAKGVLLGVVSWGIGCADAGHPGIYSEVATYYSELTTQIKS
ncbi:S1 family peptidase [Luteipulveratus mongoliensis]|uniref:Peptidase S1 and S6 chymotrypsin/Hap n=1 Tax=Luteipulveratus mongoliensis TaxID=571913 RepID=A0A0K1JF43_9MICO|nr:serine protease [Luteipulveratus mongoliensis]AKU15334.1 peptidase S1 and S6 chymotrypsin/Hap [Luteipulveratus mongoliensis]